MCSGGGEWAGRAEAQQIDVAELQQSENGKGKGRAKGQKGICFHLCFQDIATIANDIQHNDDDDDHDDDTTTATIATKTTSYL